MVLVNYVNFLLYNHSGLKIGAGKTSENSYKHVINPYPANVENMVSS